MDCDIAVSPVSADSGVAVCMDTGTVPVFVTALFVCLFVVVDYVTVHPMFVWTWVLLLTPCLCG